MKREEFRENILERDILLDQLGSLIEQVTECAENLANLIEAESVVDESDEKKEAVIRDTNEGALLLSEVTRELDDWIEQLIEPWEDEK